MNTEFTEERALWIYHHYLWLEHHLPQKQGDLKTKLVLATKEFFPDPYTHDHTAAVRIFDRVRAVMGILDWPCRLEPEEDLAQAMNSDQRRGGILGEYSNNGAAGTFSIPEENTVVITYSTALLKDPIGLVATFAHELCHYLLATITTEPPGTWDSLEPLTDLAAVVEGYGVFLCNSAFQFKQWTNNDQQGWSFQKKGYLSEVELGFALAVFCVRNRADAAVIARTLKPNAHEVFCDGLDYIEHLERSHEQTSPREF